MSDQQRCIKLAEAMGLEKRNESVEGIYPDCDGPNLPFYSYSWFSPLTDANDDYAVLEWMRVTYNTYEYLMEHQGDKWVNFITALDGSGDEGHSCCYQIGDYARAALKVIACN